MASMTSDGTWENCLGDENISDLDVPEIDDAILMQLLDECASEEADGDRLESVIRSLEDVIDPAGPAAACGGAGVMPEAVHPHEEYCEDCGLDDILSDVDGHECSRYPTFVVEDPFEWMEMEAAAKEVRSAGSDAGDWYVDECMHGPGGVGCGEARCYSSFYHYGDASMEQVYSSLWE